MGLPLETVQVLGALTPIDIPVSGFRLHPIVAAARELALYGHTPTVFEKHSTPGGMMNQGIPEFRLPRGVIEKEIEQIRRRLQHQERADRAAGHVDQEQPAQGATPAGPAPPIRHGCHEVAERQADGIRRVGRNRRQAHGQQRRKGDERRTTRDRRPDDERRQAEGSQSA